MRDIATVVLIGHPASGKSSVLRQLRIDRSQGDIDVALRGPDPGWEKTLNWLCESTLPVVVGGAHASLEDLGRIKQRGEHAKKFANLRFVYLHKLLEELVRDLRLQMAEGTLRDTASQAWTPELYDRFHRIFLRLADYTIECSGKSVEDVAAEVRAIAGPATT